LFHADRRTDGRPDGQTDMMKLIVTFFNFANAPEKFSVKLTTVQNWYRNVETTSFPTSTEHCRW